MPEVNCSDISRLVSLRNQWSGQFQLMDNPQNEFSGHFQLVDSLLRQFSRQRQLVDNRQDHLSGQFQLIMFVKRFLMFTSEHTG